MKAQFQILKLFPVLILLVFCSTYGSDQFTLFNFDSSGVMTIGHPNIISNAGLDIYSFEPNLLKLNRVGNSTATIQMGNTFNPASAWRINGRAAATNAGAAFSLFHESLADGPGEVLRMLGTGELGIGILEPLGKVHIKSNSINGFISPNLRITEDELDFTRIKLENTDQENAFWDIAAQSHNDSTQAWLNFFYANENSGSGYNPFQLRGNGKLRLTSRSNDNSSPDNILSLISPQTERPTLKFSISTPGDIFEGSGMAIEYDGRLTGAQRLNILDLSEDPVATFTNNGKFGIGGYPSAGIHVQWDGDNTLNQPHLLLEEEGFGSTYLRMKSSALPSYWEQRTLNNANQSYTEYAIRYYTNNIATSLFAINGLGSITATSLETSNTTPDHMLVLRSAASDRPTIQFSEKAPGEAAPLGMSIEYDGRLAGPSNKMNILNIDDDPIVTFENSGEVGIGTSSPTAKLEVNSSVVKKIGGGSWSATSDIRLKKDIHNFTDGLAEINKIRPIRFHYNEQSGIESSEEHIGVAAQELQKIAPYMVSEFEKDGEKYLQVDNSAMTYMLINAVKELSEENARLANKILELERKLD